MSIIQVLLVEDCPVWQSCLADFLEKDKRISVKKTVSTKDEAIQAINETSFDVIVMDMQLGLNHTDGLDAVQEIISRKPYKIIMLTAYDDEDLIRDAFCRGAVNYITKVHYADLPEAIIQAHEGQSSIHADSAEILRKSFVQLSRESMLHCLSPEERTVYELREQGYTRSQIADKLNKSIHTVKLQIRSIRSKLEAKTQ